MYQRTYSSQRWETHNRINQLQNMTDCYHHWKPFLFLIYLFWYPKKESFVIFFTVLKTFLRNCLQEKVLKISLEKKQWTDWTLAYILCSKNSSDWCKKNKRTATTSGKSGIVTSTKLCSVYLLPKKSLVWKGRRSLRRLFRWIHL